MQRDLILRGLMGAVVLGLGLWFASCTEWVEKDMPTAAKGEAKTNPFYAAQQLARSLGAQVATPTGLAQLPPGNGTLWLTSWHWDLFPENAKRLRAWVEAGGHLVIQSSMLGNEVLSWVPVAEHTLDEDEDEDDEEDAGGSTPMPPTLAEKEARCRALTEPPELPPAFADRRPFQVCGVGRRHLDPLVADKVQPLWALGEVDKDNDGNSDSAELLRVPMGRGSVTVIAPWALFHNNQVMKGDHAALMVAALQVRRGAALWFVTEESRPPLLAWLWQEAWVALLLGALALAAALWRGAVRFGPVGLAEVPVRRSMAEQITGTAQFLRQRGAGALHAAQIRALDETARTHLPNYLKLGRGERAALLARASGFDAQALNTALDRTLRRSPHAMAATLELIETARRRVLQAARDRSLSRLIASVNQTPAP